MGKDFGSTPRKSSNFRNCLSRCFLKESLLEGFFNNHGSEFPGSEIVCFDPGNVFSGIALPDCFLIEKPMRFGD
jgi:hypothetical protein